MVIPASVYLAILVTTARKVGHTSSATYLLSLRCGNGSSPNNYVDISKMAARPYSEIKLVRILTAWLKLGFIQGFCYEQRLDFLISVLLRKMQGNIYVEIWAIILHGAIIL